VAGPRGPESEGQRLTRAGWGIRDPRLLRVEGRRASVPRALPRAAAPPLCSRPRSGGGGRCRCGPAAPAARCASVAAVAPGDSSLSPPSRAHTRHAAAAASHFPSPGGRRERTGRRPRRSRRPGREGTVRATAPPPGPGACPPRPATCARLTRGPDGRLGSGVPREGSFGDRRLLPEDKTPGKWSYWRGWLWEWRLSKEGWSWGHGSAASSCRPPLPRSAQRL
jgi:hypothetical protein